MVQHRLLPLGDRRAWDDSLVGLPHAHAHLHDHVAAFQATTSAPTFLYTCHADSGEVLVACPLALRGRAGQSGQAGADVYTPYGFGGFVAARPADWFAAQWQEFGRQQGWVTSYLALNPVTAPELGFPAEVHRPAARLYLWDLRPPESHLLAGMAKNRRRELARWDAAPGPLSWDATEALAFLTAQAPGHFQRRGAGSTYAFTAETWSRLLAMPSVMTVGALADGALRTVTVFGATGDHADYLFNVSAAGYEHFSGPLIWEATRRLRSLGVTLLNLGGGVRRGEDEDSVAAFKRRFGADPVTMYAARIVHDRDRYRELCQQAGHVDPDDDGFFPPYHRGT